MVEKVTQNAYWDHDLKVCSLHICQVVAESQCISVRVGVTAHGGILSLVHAAF